MLKKLCVCSVMLSTFVGGHCSAHTLSSLSGMSIGNVVSGLEVGKLVSSESGMEKIRALMLDIIVELFFLSGNAKINWAELLSPLKLKPTVQASMPHEIKRLYISAKQILGSGEKLDPGLMLGEILRIICRNVDKSAYLDDDSGLFGMLEFLVDACLNHKISSIPFIDVLDKVINDESIELIEGWVKAYARRFSDRGNLSAAQMSEDPLVKSIDTIKRIYALKVTQQETARKVLSSIVRELFNSIWAVAKDKERARCIGFPLSAIIGYVRNMTNELDKKRLYAFFNKGDFVKLASSEHANNLKDKLMRTI